MCDQYTDTPPWIRRHRTGGHTSLISLKTKKKSSPLDNSHLGKECCTVYKPYGPLIPIYISKDQKPNYTSRYFQNIA